MVKSKGFTIRQVQILDLLIQGYQNKEIANFLTLESTTIKMHLRLMCKKVNVKNRVELAVYYVKSTYDIIVKDTIKTYDSHL